MAIVLLPNHAGTRCPTVCLCLSVWTSVKNPKLATSAASLGHVVAARVVQMRNHENPGTYFCDGQCRAWVVKPQSFIAILALHSFGEDDSTFSATLSDESMKLVEDTKFLEGKTWKRHEKT